MSLFKRALMDVCVWLGGNHPDQELLPANHSWLLPGPPMLNAVIAWANTSRVRLANAVPTRPVSPR